MSSTLSSSTENQGNTIPASCCCQLAQWVQRPASKDLGEFYFFFKQFQILSLEQKHSRVPLLAKQPDTEYTELCLQTQWGLYNFCMYETVGFSRNFPEFAKCVWKHIAVQWAYETLRKEMQVSNILAPDYFFLFLHFLSFPLMLSSLPSPWSLWLSKILLKFFVNATHPELFLSIRNFVWIQPSLSYFCDHKNYKWHFFGKSWSETAILTNQSWKKYFKGK